MSGVEIDGKTLDTIKSAAEATGYSRDYITRLAREEKVVASQIGRQWYVDLESLKQYEEATALEQKTRQQQLSEERKREREQSMRSHHDVHRHARTATLSPRAKRAMVATGALAAMVGTVTHFAPGLIDASESTSASLMAEQQTVVPTPQFVEDTKSEEKSLVHEPATVEITQRPELQNGMLLLPYASSSVTKESLQKIFSDETQLETDEHGQTFVSRVDGEGRVIERIPVMFAPTIAVREE